MFAQARGSAECKLVFTELDHLAKFRLLLLISLAWIWRGIGALMAAGLVLEGLQLLSPRFQGYECIDNVTQDLTFG